MKHDPMKKHEAFIATVLLPAIVNHARRVGVSSDEAALSAFLSLGTILQSKGFTDASLLVAIKASALSTHDAPEGLQ